MTVYPDRVQLALRFARDDYNSDELQQSYQRLRLIQPPLFISAAPAPTVTQLQQLRGAATADNCVHASCSPAATKRIPALRTTLLVLL